MRSLSGVKAAFLASALGWLLWACGSPTRPTSDSRATPCAPGQAMKVIEPQDGMYAMAYVGGVTLDGRPASPDVYRRAIADFTRLAGKRPAMVPIFQFMAGGRIEFPTDQVRAVWESGATPGVGLIPMSTWADGADAIFTMQRFIDGAFDPQLIEWGRLAKASGLPLVVTFGGEVNAGWPWSGHYNGGGVTTAYGDPRWPDGPERYRDAHRHVVRLLRSQGVNNLTWAFGGAIEMDEPWYALRYYYPGDEYVDWIAAGVWGYYPPFFDQWRSFPSMMDELYGQLRAVAPTKPMMIEMGVVDDPLHDKAAWIAEAFSTLRAGRWPRVKSISYWNEADSTQDANGRPIGTAIDSTPAVLRAYQSGIGQAFFLDTVRFRCGD